MQGEKLGGYRDIQTGNGGWNQDGISGGAVKLKVELMEFTDVSVRGVQNDALEKCGVTAG